MIIVYIIIVFVFARLCLWIREIFFTCYQQPLLLWVRNGRLRGALSTDVRNSTASFGRRIKKRKSYLGVSPRRLHTWTIRVVHEIRLRTSVCRVVRTPLGYAGTTRIRVLTFRRPSEGQGRATKCHKLKNYTCRRYLVVRAVKSARKKKPGIYYNRIIYTTLRRARRSRNGVRNSSNFNELHASNICQINKYHK